MTELHNLEDQEKANRAKKMMLWFGIISLIMSFGAFTSAYIVSRKRDDWLDNYELPSAFYISTIIIICSSITIFLALRNIKSEKRKVGMLWLIITFLLGVTFGILQIQGFSQIIEDFGYNFTGPTSNITFTYIFLIAAVHLAHIAAALLVLLVVIYNHYKQKYYKGQTLGIELAATFWHFVDILWIYLFLFLYFVR